MGLSQHDKVPSTSITGGVFRDQINDYQLFNKARQLAYWKANGTEVAKDMVE